MIGPTISSSLTGGLTAPRNQPKSAQQIEAEFVDCFVQVARTQTSQAIEPIQSQDQLGLSPTTAAFLAASRALTPAQVMATAGAAFAATQPQLSETLDAQYQEERVPLGRLQDDEVGLFAHEDVSAAVTTGSNVYLNPALASVQGTAVFDWIVGHELGHIESDDGLAAIGRSFLIGQLAADQIPTETIAPLEEIHHAMNRSAEFEADLEGLEYAVDQGHDREVVVQASEQFLSAVGGQDEAHPPAPLRIARLRPTR